MKTLVRTKKNNVNYPGMFDLIKGYAIITVILEHIADKYNESLFLFGNNVFINFLLGIRGVLGLWYLTIPIFLVVSGYGFRNTEPLKCLKKQVNLLIKPYIITASYTCAFHVIIHFLFFRNIKSAIVDTFLVLAGFLLGTSTGINVGKYSIHGIGTVWFILALFWGWNILDFIFAKVKEKYRIYVVILCFLIGWILNFFITLPLCINQGLAAVPFLYVGYLAKKYDVFSYNYSVAICVMAAILFLGSFFTPFEFCIVKVPLGPITLFIITGAAVTVIWLFLKLNKIDCVLFSAISFLGRYSLWVICIDAVTTETIPWYLWVSRFEATPLKSYLGMLIVKVTIEGIALFIIYEINKFRGAKKRKLKKQRRESNAVR